MVSKAMTFRWLDAQDYSLVLFSSDKIKQAPILSCSNLSFNANCLGDTIEMPCWKQRDKMSSNFLMDFFNEHCLGDMIEMTCCKQRDKNYPKFLMCVHAHGHTFKAKKRQDRVLTNLTIQMTQVRWMEVWDH